MTNPQDMFGAYAKFQILLFYSEFSISEREFISSEPLT